MEQTNITSDIDQPVETSSINPITPKPNNIYKYLFFVTLLILLGLIVFFYTYTISQKTAVNNDNTIEEVIKTTPDKNVEKETNYENKESIEKTKSTLIYTEEISSVSNNGRAWPTLRIYRVINNSDPEVLVPSIGQVGEYPLGFILSPDKKSILVNLETKLVVIDLVTKEVKDILKFDQGGNNSGVTYSPDSKKLFVWDQQYVGNNRNYSVYIYDIATREKTILKNGTTNLISMTVVKWRDDNKIILYEPHGETADLWVFDLKNKTLDKKGNEFGRINENGTLMDQIYLTVNDPCNEMAGTDAGGYKLIDPVTLVQKDQVDGHGKVVRIIDMSPQGDQIIYSMSDPIDPNKVKNIYDCESLYLTQESSSQYFLKKIKEPQSPITDYKSILKKWGTQYGEAKNIGGSVIQNGTQRITGATEESQLRIIAQFLQ